MREIKDTDVPKELRHLPRFIVTARRPATREEAQRSDIEWGVTTKAGLLAAAARRFSRK